MNIPSDRHAWFDGWRPPPANCCPRRALIPRRALDWAVRNCQPMSTMGPEMAPFPWPTWGGHTHASGSTPAKSIQMVVTSPPYWNLRDYQTGTWEGGDRKTIAARIPRRPIKGTSRCQKRSQRRSGSEFPFRRTGDGDSSDPSPCPLSKVKSFARETCDDAIGVMN
jgi:hypothetical protein